MQQVPAAIKQWVVTPAEKSKFDAMFVQADTNSDGLVSGMAALMISKDDSVFEAYPGIAPFSCKC